MHTNEQLIVAAPIVLGAAATWISWRLGLPSILLLLLTGLTCGPVLGILVPDEQLSALAAPLISLAVGIIMFEGGLTLRLKDLRGAAAGIRNMVLLGIPATAVLTWLAAYYILDFSSSLAFVFAALMVVTGPTVIVPLLRNIKPPNRVAQIVRWEGVLNDGLGALLAVLVLGTVVAESESSATATMASFLFFIVTATLIGLLGASMMIAAARWFLIPHDLENASALAFVVFTFSASNLVQAESGLLAVIAMGAAVANQPWVPVRRLTAFKEDLRVILIGSLFIVLAAGLTWTDIRLLGWQVTLFVALLILVVRPVVVFACTIGADLTWKERLFISWMAPRGIVAAAAAAAFTPQLLDSGVVDAGRLEPVTFAVIIVTVLVYGTTALPLAKRLGLANPSPKGVVIVGAHAWARKLGQALQGVGYQVEFIDNNWSNVTAARLKGFRTHFGSIVSGMVVDKLDLHGIAHMLALTSNDEVNSLACTRFRDILGRQHTFQLPPERFRAGRPDSELEELHGRLLFTPETSYQVLASKLAGSNEIKVTKLNEAFTLEDVRRQYGQKFVPLFALEEGKLHINTLVHPIELTSKTKNLTLALIPETVEEEVLEPPEPADRKKQLEQAVSAHGTVV